MDYEDSYLDAMYEDRFEPMFYEDPPYLHNEFPDDDESDSYDSEAWDEDEDDE
jgi:hypothetical protein